MIIHTIHIESTYKANMSFLFQVPVGLHLETTRLPQQRLNSKSCLLNLLLFRTLLAAGPWLSYSHEKHSKIRRPWERMRNMPSWKYENAQTVCPQPSAGMLLPWRITDCVSNEFAIGKIAVDSPLYVLICHCGLNSLSVCRLQCFALSCTKGAGKRLRQAGTIIYFAEKVGTN